MEFKPSNHYRQKHRQKPSVEHESNHPQQKTIDINVDFGSLPKPKELARIVLAFVSKRSKKQFIAFGAILAVIAIVLAFPSLQRQAEILTGSKTETASTDKTGKKPGYETLLPEGKTIASLGGWSRVSPPNSDPAFAYADKIEGVPVTVSQQPLPEIFEDETEEQIKELAKGFGANDLIKVDDLTLYIGTSAKGPQSVIFTKKNLLILIKSQVKIDDESWKKYAKSLN